MSEQPEEGCKGCEAGNTSGGESFDTPPIVPSPFQTVPGIGPGVRIRPRSGQPAPMPPPPPRLEPNPARAMGESTMALVQMNNMISKGEAEILALINILIHKNLLTQKDVDEEVAVIRSQKRAEESHKINLAFLFVMERMTTVQTTTEAVRRVLDRRGVVTQAELSESLSGVVKEHNDAVMGMMGNMMKEAPPFNPGATSDPRRNPR